MDIDIVMVTVSANTHNNTTHYAGEGGPGTNVLSNQFTIIPNSQIGKLFQPAKSPTKGTGYNLISVNLSNILNSPDQQPIKR